MSKDSLVGVIENIVYRNENNDYTVIEISDNEQNLLTAVGIMPMAFGGENVILHGSWVYHKEFGKQFAFDSFEKTLPKEVDGILQYLSSKTVKGIGPVTALKIVNRFGADSFDVIENHPEWLADIPGITMKKAAAISESFREQTGARDVIMFCKDFMTAADATKIYKRYGTNAIGAIQNNPYMLCDGTYGVSFATADNIAKNLGHAPDSVFRILSGAEYVLKYNASMNGHTCLPFDKLISCAEELLQISRELIEKTVKNLIRAGNLAQYRDGDNEYVMTLEGAEAEDYIASKLSDLFENTEKFSIDDIAYLIEKTESTLGIEYAEMQRRAIYEAFSHGALIITGGPGTGKTTIINALATIFKSLGQRVVLAAPTGRAAKRMSEATGLEAKTVHRLLETEKTGDGESKFNRNQNIPLDEKVVIIDEASMLDVYITKALLLAMRRGSRLILIGDSDQLPSVGAGNVLTDIITSERITTIRLTEIFRQSSKSLIVTNAHRINDGEAPLLNVTDNDFFFVRRENEGSIPTTIASLITERLPKTYGTDIKERIQVITPSHKGAGGVEILNKELQACLNPATQFKVEKMHHDTVFREGDRVMQNTNDYDIEWERFGVQGSGIFNGDIGVIERIDLKKEILKIRFDDKLATYSFDVLEELDLAYAITVHKSQGSEYPVVILPMYYCAPMLLTRNLLYTAVTRAKNMIILVGRSDIAGKMVENNRHILRYTTLRHRICDYR